MDDVVDRLPGDGDAGGDVHRHSLVVLHLRQRGPCDVQQWHGLAPPARGLLAGEDQEVLTVAPHAGGQVVEPEQVSEAAVVLLALLQAVDQRDLPLDQGLRAAGEVHEHGADVAAELGLVARQADGLAVDLVEGPGHFADLVGGGDADGQYLRRPAVALGLTQLLHHLGQAPPGDLQRLAPQPPQRADQRPGHDDGDREDQDEEDGHDADVDGGLALVAACQLGRAVDDGTAQGPLHVVHAVQALARGVEPEVDVVRASAAEPAELLVLAGELQDALDQAGGAVDLLAADGVGVQLPLGERRPGEEHLELAGLLRAGGVEGLQLGLAEPAGDQRHGDEASLPGRLLGGAGERREGGRTGVQGLVRASAGGLVEDGEQVVEDERVLLERGERRELRVCDRRAERADLGEPVEQAGDHLAADVSESRLDDLPAVLDDLDGRVDRVLLVGELGLVAAAARGDEPRREVAFDVELVAEVAQARDELGHGPDAFIFGGALHRGRHSQATEQDRHQGGYQDQRDKTSPDPPVTQSEQASRPVTRVGWSIRLGTRSGCFRIGTATALDCCCPHWSQPLASWSALGGMGTCSCDA